MKLSKFREKSNEYTAKASEITRQLSLAGIAVIWLFKNTGVGQPILEKYLLIPLLSLCLALFLDLIQYIIGGHIWISFFRKIEQQIQSNNDIQDNDPDIKAPKQLNIVIYCFYYAKIALMVFSYFFILGYIIDKI